MISKTLDDFILEKDKAYWKVKLSNGEFAYQDDDRPGFSLPSWYRLKEYCEQNDVYPTDMWITFRSHTECCGHSETGFFFTFGVLAAPGGPTEYRYVCGPIIDDIIHTTAWKVPEILPQEVETRPVEGNEKKCISRSLMVTNAHHNTT